MTLGESATIESATDASTAHDTRPIFLTGFMGAGKTTVGKSLARKLELQFLDLDGIIEARAGKSVAEIFRERGEVGFREVEREAIESCRSIESAVIALGGGAYVPAENRTLLRTIGTTVWIDCPLEVCMLRISTDPARPLAGGLAEMAELLKLRKPAYEQADLVVRVGAQGSGRVALMIVELLDRKVIQPATEDAEEG
jgi:shikimate kinase